MCRRLDALGDDVVAEGRGHGDDTLNDRCVARVGAEAGDERAVDLDRIDRKLAQERERRVAGAEVVEREVDAERSDALEVLEAVGDLHRRGLGELDRDLLGVELEFLQRGFDLGDEVAAAELRGGRVDRDVEAATVFLPGVGAAQALRSTWLPRALISPDVSATSMKCSGPSRPRSDGSNARAPRRRRRDRSGGR